jgi:hypothetical protein
MQIYKQGHWIFHSKFDPRDWYGFLYLVHHRVTNRYYIGRKSMWARFGKRNAKELPWRTYGTSSKEVWAIPKDELDFIILKLYGTKGQLNHAENNILQKVDAITRKHPTLDLPLFLNRQAGATRWIPKEFDHDEITQIAARILAHAGVAGGGLLGAGVGQGASSAAPPPHPSSAEEGS